MLQSTQGWVELFTKPINPAAIDGYRFASYGADSHSGYPKIVFSNLGNRALMSASRTTLRCSTPFFVVWIRPASRRIRQWLDSVDLAMPGHGMASVQDMQSFFCASRLLTM